MEQLKPCPFCGRKMMLRTVKDPDMDIQVIGHDDYAQIICPLFRGLTWFGSVEEAIEAWNRRTND